MRFTEREMTVAVDAVARQAYGATRMPWRRGAADEAWESLPTIEKYNRRSVIGEMVLPALQALPERPTVGATPQFTDEEYAAAAEVSARSLLDQRKPGAWEAMSDRRRRALVKTTSAVTRAAVESMPLRRDPDDLTVPDHL